MSEVASEASNRVFPSNVGSSYVVISSYTDLSTLAHQPKGAPADYGLRLFHLDENTGNLTLLHVVSDDEVNNVAFIRSHPTRNILYCVTESIKTEGSLLVFSINAALGTLTKLQSEPCGGRSTCYVTLSYDLQQLYAVNYWDSTVQIFDLDVEGHLLGRRGPPFQVPGKNAGVEARKHGDDPHGSHRLAETHAHALVLDPVFGRVAYVPDLGEDNIKQLVIDRNLRTFAFAGSVKASPEKKPSGPRYIEFHQFFNVAYVVNELASTVTVFAFDEEKASRLAKQDGPRDTTLSTLEPVQVISTVPKGFPRQMNTCGRVAVDPLGKYVLVSNRGHDSIAVFPVIRDRDVQGTLEAPRWYHTGGRTPRHFKFSNGGQWMLSANQDDDTLVCFSFNQNTGALSFIGKYQVPSPNFICLVRTKNCRRQDSWVYSRM